MRSAHAAELTAERDRLFELAARKSSSTPDTSVVEAIVFSKDRPMQLDALLRSLSAQVTPRVRTHVLHRASDLRTARAYEAVRARHTTVEFVAERAFRRDLIERLESVRAPRVFFLVDDIVFIRPLHLERVDALDPREFLLSLRLWPGLTYCYSADRPLQAPSDLTCVRGERGSDDAEYTWSWDSGQDDWGYVHSVDGNVFDTREMLAVAHATSFRHPNSFEPAIGRFAERLRSRPGRCFGGARLINIPDNRVQDDVANRSHSQDPMQLVARFEAGEQIAIESYYGVNAPSVHVELPLRFELAPSDAAEAQSRPKSTT